MAEDKNTLHDNTIGWSIILIILIILLWMAWHFLGTDIKSAIRWIRWGELWILSFFLDDDYQVLWGKQPVVFEPWYEGIPKIPPSRLDGATMGAISTLAMTPLRWIFVGVLACMSIWALIWGPGTQFRRKLGLEGLIPQQARNFPIIEPFVRFNPSKLAQRPPGSPVPEKLPLFAEALSPEEWLVYNGIPVADNRLVNEEAASEAFARQLGKPWQGPNTLEPYMQVLLAAFCLKTARKRRDSERMLGQIALCWSHDKGLMLSRNLLREARKVLRDKNLAGKTLARCNQHAFQSTAMIRALATAREEGGVLAPAEFLWLRGFDRALWYPLNNIGRQSYHMEALGAMAHYKAEKIVQRPIPRPKVDDAVQSIVDYMKSPKARALPKLESAKTRKKPAR